MASFLRHQGPGLLYLCVAYNDPFWHFTLSISILKLHNTALHNTAPLHLTSPLQCALCWDRRGIYTDQACGGGSAEGQHSLISFSPGPFDISTQSPSPPLPVSLHRMWEMHNKCDCLHVRLSWTRETCRIFRTKWFSILSRQGLNKAKQLGSWEENEKECDRWEGRKDKCSRRWRGQW